MGNESEERNEAWGNWAGHRTFIFAVVCVVGFGLAALIYIH